MKYEIPAAPTGDKWAEQWAILDLQFQVKPGGAKLTAEFLTRLEGSEEIADERFGIEYTAAEPFEFDKTTIEVGELTDASPTQNHEVLVYSSTRNAAELAKLIGLVSMPPGSLGEAGPFVTVGKMIPIPDSKLEPLAIQISRKSERPVRVQSAFRIPVTVNAKVGDAKLDIGTVERLIAFTQGSDTKQIHLKGSMRGPANIVGAKEAQLRGLRQFRRSDRQHHHRDGSQRGGTRDREGTHRTELSESGTGEAAGQRRTRHVPVEGDDPGRGTTRRDPRWPGRASGEGAEPIAVANPGHRSGSMMPPALTV